MQALYSKNYKIFSREFKEAPNKKKGIPYSWIRSHNTDKMCSEIDSSQTDL